ncbi:uncharacterized protein ALTATR162_LOCUS3675 [Alternaria atra]|uniref:Uncharacterized protein n=1 Tax=Alternaria atra TaxID=119953 RepID=A0A8J2N4F3_9PLEO|nr:uncharacterized protein ALTATR162_LOCUS3675 [Alternaria atra]CAG5155465.1 unnamed protein product [Alternaria atra]
MKRSSTIIVLSALSMGVLGGVVPGPYYLNSTAHAGTPRPHVHAPGLPTPPPVLSSSSPEPSTAIVAPYSTPSWNTSIATASPSSSNTYAVSSSSPEASTVALSVSSSFNLTAQNATSIYYSPLSSSTAVTQPLSIPTSGDPSMVVVVVSETVYATAQQSSSPASNATLPTVSTSDCSTILTASVTQSSFNAVPSSAVVTSIPPSPPMAALGNADELAGSTIDLGLLSSILLPDTTIDLEVLSSILLPDTTPRPIATVTTTTTVVLSLPTLPLPSPSDIESSASKTTTTTIVALPTMSSSTPAASPPSTSTSDSVVPSSSAVDSASTILSTVTVTSSTPSSSSNTESTPSNTDFPTAPPFSYNPSASRGSASPISRPTPEPSSANVAGSTLSTTATPTSTFISQYTGIPPAPSAAGASGLLSKRNKEKVWWVAFFVPFLLMA